MAVQKQSTPSFALIASFLPIVFYCVGFIRLEVELNEQKNRINALESVVNAISPYDPPDDPNIKLPKNSPGESESWDSNHFDYCDIVWGNCGKMLRDKLQKLQNRAARVLTFSNHDADATGLLEFLGWKNLARQQEIHKATMMFRFLHGLQ